VDVLGIGQAGILHRLMCRRGHLADLAHAANFFRRHRLGSSPAHHQPLLSVGSLFVRHLDPLSSDGRDVRSDHARAATREDEDDVLRNLVRWNAEEFASPVAQRHIGPHATPVVMKPCPFGLADQGDQGVGLDLS
jgi:hypothetical protein